MHRMANILLAERAPHDARILVVGAGGGMETKHLAMSNPDWTFFAVDPSAEMLASAKANLGPLASRVVLHEGYVETAPSDQCDGATCLLTMHFLPRPERLSTLQEIRRRLRPGAPFVAAHLSFERLGIGPNDWLSRYAAFAASSGVDPDKARAGADAMGRKLPILSPDEEEQLLREAGFDDIAVFYAGMAFRGWIAYA
jgi:tRNA (cmo5U34)-methyltransferase